MPAASDGVQQPRGREAVELLDRRRLVADRRRQVDHGVHAPQRLASDSRVAEVGQVAERDPDLDPHSAESAGVADEHADVVAALEQARQERLTDGSGGAGHEDHRSEL